MRFVEACVCLGLSQENSVVKFSLIFFVTAKKDCVIETRCVI